MGDATDNGHFYNIMARLEPYQKLVVFQLICASLFTICYVEDAGIIFLAIRAITGSLALIILPGATITAALFPESIRNIWVSVFVGIILAVIQIQVLFSLALFFLLQVFPTPWLLLTSTMIVFISALFKWNSTLLSALSPRVDKDILGVFVFAFGVRVLMLMLAQYSIAPDAAVYADFARNILCGEFNSNVMNDPTILNLWNGTQYTQHQGMVYLFTLSWLLAEPTTGGPTFILAIMGTLLLYPTYQIVKDIFSQSTARIIIMILAVHPLFIFHSGVAYGPEISSLFFMLYGLLLLFSNGNGRTSAFIAGLAIGVGDIIWYPNFFMLCVLLTVYCIFRVMQKKDSFRALILFMPLILLSRVSTYTFWYLTILALVALFALVLVRIESKEYYKKQLFFTAGIFVILTLFRGPLLVTLNGIPFETLSLSGLGVNTTLLVMQWMPSFYALFNIEIIGWFLFFVFFHTTPVLSFLVIWSLMRGKKQFESRFIVMLAIIGAAGTYVVFLLFSFYKSTLLPVYLFSDSRFFLSIVWLLTISAGGYLLSLESAPPLGSTRRSIRFRMNHRTKTYIVLGLVICGFIPSYAVMPTGLQLTEIEGRFSWQNLADKVSELGRSNSTFLVDRAGEFTWLTGEKSVVLKLSGLGLPYYRAMLDIRALASQFEIDYFVMDYFTLARWETMDILLSFNIGIGEHLLAELEEMRNYITCNSTEPLASLALVTETSLNDRNERVRIFSFGESAFTKHFEISSFESGWLAENGGNLSRVGNLTRFTIGQNESSAILRREADFDLNLVTETGFLLLNIEDSLARVTNISIWDDDGLVVYIAEKIGPSLYFCPIGHGIVGDVRVAIAGNSGEHVTLRSFGLWYSS